MVGIWSWDDLRGETNWFENIVMPAVEQYRENRERDKTRDGMHQSNDCLTGTITHCSMSYPMSLTCSQKVRPRAPVTIATGRVMTKETVSKMMWSKCLQTPPMIRMMIYTGAARMIATKRYATRTGQGSSWICMGILGLIETANTVTSQNNQQDIVVTSTKSFDI